MPGKPAWICVSYPFWKGFLKRLEKTHFASNKSWYGLSSYLEIYLALEPSCEVFVLFIFTEIFIIADIQGFNRIDFNWNLLAILLLLLQTLFNLKEHVSYS